MLTSITVENFRGIERLHVEGLGRVNLIIGRNDSGKTALMEALLLARDPRNAIDILTARQRMRVASTNNADLADFDEFWLPIFHRMDALAGFRIHSTSFADRPSTLAVAKEPVDGPMTIDGVRASVVTPAWTLKATVTGGRHETTSVIDQTATGEKLPTAQTNIPSRWISPSPVIGSEDIRAFSKLKQQGRDEAVTELLRYVNDQISGVELLAPTGNRVSVYVRLRREGLVPLLMMGEGMKRYFKFAVSFAATDGASIHIDEIENGLHHSVMEPLWAWISRATQAKFAQVFATTHSEECVQAASRVFKAQNDVGLRVIRLDKQEHETRAVVYDRDLVEAAERMGVEIRG
ncbi:AAA family ATPase [Corallococcus exiguus]|uniref:AAA family ATPase n=1 Tax=Corallococcus exiguus TaxID=83462 RepID=UPI001474933E|nr:ATP-binding protein [Corallococcus exiguus]NNB98542.1 AAA family ATPase [Corallococcus exiguus]